MKRFIQSSAVAVLTAILSVTAFADVKVKSRTTMSGQSYENTTYIKGKRSRTEQNMGGNQMVNITQCDLKRGIQLNPQMQVYMVNAWENDTTAPTTKTTTGNTTTEVKKGGVITTTITTKDTGETKKMFGYTARHLIITTETEASADACTPMKKTKMVTDGWYIDAAFALDCDYGWSGGYSPRNSGGCRDKYDVKQIGTAKRGYPVIEKMTMFDESGKESFTMTNEVLELATATLDAALFDIPQGYREVQDSSAMYASMTPSSQNSNVSSNSSNIPTNNTSTSNSSLSSTVQSMNSQKTEANSSATLEPKKEGVVRVGLANVKTGAVGEGINAVELAGAVQNTLAQYFKGTKIEVVNLEAKLQSAIDAEAEEKDCDYVLYATVSHKKGGGGFGMFAKVAPVLGNVVPMAGMGSTAGAIAGSVASTAIYTAGSAAGSIKAKDELTLDIKLQKGTTATLTKQYKAKAKSAGEDIISPIVEQAATEIVATIGK
ncbi:MAG TPA: hypothetical protein VIL74_24075 [Pyrinomonadaceae bacterium]|jgi:hypothetical protein